MLYSMYASFILFLSHKTNIYIYTYFPKEKREGREGAGENWGELGVVPQQKRRKNYQAKRDIIR